jgi:hypothetical protein
MARFVVNAKNGNLLWLFVGDCLAVTAINLNVKSAAMLAIEHGNVLIAKRYRQQTAHTTKLIVNIIVHMEKYIARKYANTAAYTDK